MLTLRTTTAASTALASLRTSQRAMVSATQQLSSGLRIGSARDDAAGLDIATGLTSQIRGLDQALRNASDGIALIQTGDAAAQEITRLLQRMRELAVQAATGTYDGRQTDARPQTH